MQVNAIFFLEFIGQILNQTQIEIFSTEKRIPVSREYFKLMLSVDFGNLNDRNIEGAATEVVNRNGAIALRLVHSVGKRSRRRLVDDSLDLEACDLASILGRLAL